MRFECIKEITVKDGKNTVDAFKGKTYTVYDPQLPAYKDTPYHFIGETSITHYMSEDFLKEHFKLCASTKEKVLCNGKEDLSVYPIESLMEWRNTASKRCDKIDEDLTYLCNCYKELLRKAVKLAKKRKKDVRWIVRLNKELDRKVFRDRG